uniref:Uncharacterized protein n=1 Tax=Arundo donax TaxID=35708 RepID=A0A0A9DAV0_ARUDO
MQGRVLALGDHYTLKCAFRCVPFGGTAYIHLYLFSSANGAIYNPRPQPPPRSARIVSSSSASSLSWNKLNSCSSEAYATRLSPPSTGTSSSSSLGNCSS